MLEQGGGGVLASEVGHKPSEVNNLKNMENCIYSNIRVHQVNNMKFKHYHNEPIPFEIIDDPYRSCRLYQQLKQ